MCCCCCLCNCCCYRCCDFEDEIGNFPKHNGKCLIFFVYSMRLVNVVVVYVIFVAIVHVVVIVVVTLGWNWGLSDTKSKVNIFLCQLVETCVVVVYVIVVAIVHVVVIIVVTLRMKLGTFQSIIESVKFFLSARWDLCFVLKWHPKV